MGNERNTEHDLIAACIIELGRRGSDPLMIRCALAINLVNLCDKTSNEPAVDADVRAVVEASKSFKDIEKAKADGTRIRH